MQHIFAEEIIKKTKIMKMTTQHLEELRKAFQLLEYPSVAIKVSNLVGNQVEKLVDSLPEKVKRGISKASNKAIEKATKIALLTLKNNPTQKANDRAHKIVVGVSGGLSGFFGAAATAADIVFSTTVMLRSIADIARSEGADLDEVETQLNCMTVFGLGGKTSKDDSAETMYYASRSALSQAVKGSLSFLSKSTLADVNAPALLSLMKKVAEKFSIQLTEKAAAQFLPAIGALGGGAINLIFIDHFQDMARGHFIVRRLEKEYGDVNVRREYEKFHKK